MASKLEVEQEVKAPAEKFWAAVVNSTEVFPKILPDQYKSIEPVEGDGKSVGTVRLVKYSGGIPSVTFSKEKVEAVDEANKLISYSVIEGEMLDFYKTFKVTFQLVPKGDGGDGGMVKLVVEYEKASEEVPEPEMVKETALQTFKELDAHLLKN